MVSNGHLVVASGHKSLANHNHLVYKGYQAWCMKEMMLES